MKRIIKYTFIFTILSFNLYAQTEVEYYNSGYIKTLSENFDGAIKDFNAALEINPNYTKARLARGLSFQQLMNKEKEKNAKSVYYILCLKDFDYLISNKVDKQYLTIRGNIHMSWYFYSKNTKYRTLACADWKRAYTLGDIKAGEFLTDYCK